MSQSIPRMTLHKASGQAVVRLMGRDVYLGPWQSATAKKAYDRAIAEWLANGRLQQTSTDGHTITELIAAFWDYAQTYYRHVDGSPTNEIRNYRDAMRPVPAIRPYAGEGFWAAGSQGGPAKYDRCGIVSDWHQSADRTNQASIPLGGRKRVDFPDGLSWPAGRGGSKSRTIGSPRIAAGPSGARRAC